MEDDESQASLEVKSTGKITGEEERSQRSKKQWGTEEERNSWVNGLRREVCVRREHFPETQDIIKADGSLNPECGSFPPFLSRLGSPPVLFPPKDGSAMDCCGLLPVEDHGKVTVGIKFFSIF